MLYTLRSIKIKNSTRRISAMSTDEKHKTQPDAFFSEKKTEDKVQYDQHIVHTAVECIPWYKVILIN